MIKSNAMYLASQTFHALDPVFSSVAHAQLLSPLHIWLSLYFHCASSLHLVLNVTFHRLSSPKPVFLGSGSFFLSFKTTQRLLYQRRFLLSSFSRLLHQPPTKQDRIPSCVLPSIGLNWRQSFLHFLSLTFPVQEAKACLCLSSLYPQHWVHNRNPIESAY